MSNTLEVHSAIVSYADENVSNNPRLKSVDWSKSRSAITSGRPLISEFVIPSNSGKTLFSGIYTLGLDTTTELTLSILNAAESTYRLTHTGGTAPDFRAPVALDLTGEELTITINNNATAKFNLSGPGIATFSLVSNNHEIFIPGVLTGDAAGPFSENNVGHWVVLALTDGGKSIIVKRLDGVSFDGVGEVVTVTSDTDIQFYSRTGIMLGDKFIVNNLSSANRQTFEVLDFTASRIDFVSADPLPEEVLLMGRADDFIIFSDAKMFVRVEADEDIAVRFNGDTTNNVLVSPIVTNSINDMGWIEKYGLTYDLYVRNMSKTDPVKVILISVG